MTVQIIWLHYRVLVNIDVQPVQECFLPTKPIQFENRVYQGMNNPDEYLKSVFGDYMKLPPEEERVNHNAIKIVFEDNQ